MAEFTIRRGYDIPMKGAAEPTLREAQAPKFVAIKPTDFKGIKPRLLVQVGDDVSIGTPLVEDKTDPRIRFVSPGGGKVVAVNRGRRRRLEEIVIEISPEETALDFQARPIDQIDALDDRVQVQANLLEAGLWPLIIQRPYARIATPDVEPQAIFVSAHDTEPLTADQIFLIKDRREDFEAGLTVLSKFTEGCIHLCLPKNPNLDVPWLNTAKGCCVQHFSGPHPTGCFGTFIENVEPIRHGKTAWTLKAVDVADIGKFFLTGRYPTERIVAVSGESIESPGYFRTRAGAHASTLLPKDLSDSENRVISGGVLTGTGIHREGFLGFYHSTLTVIREGGKRRLFGWLDPGFTRSSYSRAFVSAFKNNGSYSFDTSMNGDKRAIVPIGSYESVMALDIEPTFLFKSIMYGDLEEAGKLGLLDVAEEDVALCSYVCHSKIDYCSLVRQALDQYEKEG
ncbi:MAG: Na(+)-translocating NADH-quinone reductase subunit A [Candidatus Omnitrophica bacterium]|nr:Na(+)-translocating NADH-quinone reductase subunit A [Candidatus Omnitrophota bacterium]